MGLRVSLPSLQHDSLPKWAGFRCRYFYSTVIVHILPDPPCLQIGRPGTRDVSSVQCEAAGREFSPLTQSCWADRNAHWLTGWTRRGRRTANFSPHNGRPRITFGLTLWQITEIGEMLGISERLDWWIFLVEMSCMIEGLTRPRMVRTSATTALRRTTSRDTTAPRQVIMSLSWSQLNIWLSQAWRVWRRGGWERLGRRRRGRGSWERLKPREDGRWGESGERERVGSPDSFIEQFWFVSPGLLHEDHWNCLCGSWQGLFPLNGQYEESRCGKKFPQPYHNPAILIWKILSFIASTMLFHEINSRETVPPWCHSSAVPPWKNVMNQDFIVLLQLHHLFLSVRFFLLISPLKHLKYLSPHSQLTIISSFLYSDKVSLKPNDDL